MPKQKTHKGAAKRFKRTARGKIKRRRAYHSHNLGHKSPGRKRHLRKAALVDKADKKKIDRLLP